jgi:trimeric autotransporter adhesin
VKTTQLFLLLTLTCTVTARALDPPPDGCYPNFTTAEGCSALSMLTTGVENTAMGTSALFFTTTGSQNTAFGTFAMYGSNGSNNAAFGDKALANAGGGNKNVAVGYAALSYCSGRSNIGIGAVGGVNLTTGNQNIDIGNEGETEDDSTIRIGHAAHRRTFIAGIARATVPDGLPVVVTAAGQLGLSTSSARYKEAIQPMGKASEALLALKPVTFHYKKDLDPKAIPQFGLVAEQVAKVDPNLVARDDSGKPYTVRYEAVNAMLLNEFLKAHRKLEKLETIVGRLEATVEKQAAQLQKVNERLEAIPAAPRLVENR